jgi:pseudouridine synthase
MPKPRRNAKAAPRQRSTAPPNMQRLQRVMAEAGVASRRACEELIERGAVEVNGEVVTDLPIFVDPREDRILVQGRPLPKVGGPGERGGRGAKHIYIMLNKPERTLTTVTDEREFHGEGGGRRTVMDLVNHPAKARLFPVGRLDYATRGLVLLTNDGELANKLTHPRYGVHKTYEAVVKGVLPDDALQQLERGIYLAERKEGRTVGAKRTAHVDLRIIKRERDRTTVEITLREGRNRQVRRMFAGIGHPVKKLTRVAMGPLKLKGVAMGAWRELEAREVNALEKAARTGQNPRQ